MQTRSSVQVQNSDNENRKRSFNFMLLIGLLCLTTLTTIGLSIFTGFLSHQNRVIKEKFKVQSLSLKEGQLCCQQQCSGGDDPEEPPTPSVNSSNMYRINGTYKVDGQTSGVFTKYFTFGINNTEHQNGEDYTIEQVCQNTEECEYEAQQAITVDNYGRLNIINLYEGEADDDYAINNMTWGMPWLQNVNQSSVFIDTFNLGINATNCIDNQCQKVIISNMLNNHQLLSFEVNASLMESITIDAGFIDGNINITSTGFIDGNININGQVDGNINLGTDTTTINNTGDTPTVTPTENSLIRKTTETSALLSGSINVYGDIHCSNEVCVNVQGSISADTGHAIYVGDSITAKNNGVQVQGSVTATNGNGVQVGGSIGNINVQSSIGTLSAKSIGVVKITYDTQTDSGSEPISVIEKIVLYDSSDTNTPTLTVNGITNNPSITGLTNGNIQINTLTNVSIGDIIISNVSNESSNYSLINSIQVKKLGSNQTSVSISNIDNTFNIDTVTSSGTIESLDTENIKYTGTNDSSGDGSNTITLSPPPKSLTLVFNDSSTMESIKIQDKNENDKIIISDITDSFSITNLTTEGVISNIIVKGTGSSLANVSLVDYATIGTINIEVPASIPTNPTAVISNISLYPKDKTYNDSQLNIEGVYNDYTISKINAYDISTVSAQNEIGTVSSLNNIQTITSAQISGDIIVNGGIQGSITAGSIGSTDASTSTVLKVTTGITGSVSLGNVACGDTLSFTSINCVEMGDVTIFGKVQTNAIKINSITSYASSNGIRVSFNVRSDNKIGIYIGGEIQSRDDGIYVGKQITTSLSSNAIQVGNNITDFTVTPNAIQGNIYVKGGVDGTITVDNSIGSLTAGGITTTATITGNIGQSLQVTGTVGGDSVPQAINIGGQITCGNGTSGCVQLNSVSTGSNIGVQISSIGSLYKAIDIAGKTTCGGDTSTPKGTGIDCISIGEVEAYAYVVETSDVMEITTLYNAININTITSHRGNAISSGNITAGSTGISTNYITCGTNENLASGHCVSMGTVTIYGEPGTNAINTAFINAYDSSGGIKTNSITSIDNGIYIDGGVYSTQGNAINSRTITARNAGIISGDITCGTNETSTTSNCVKMGDVTIYGANGTSAINTGTITSYNNSNGVYVNSSINIHSGRGIQVDDGIIVNSTDVGYGVSIQKGTSAYAIQVQGNSTCIMILGDIISEKGDSINIFGNVTSTKGMQGIYAYDIKGYQYGIHVRDNIESTATSVYAAGSGIFVEKNVASPGYIAILVRGFLISNDKYGDISIANASCQCPP